jgi:hypothetical protein
MKALLEFLRHFLYWCIFMTLAVGCYYNWMYRRHRRRDPFSDPSPGDSPLAVFSRKLSDETRAYRRKAIITLLLLCALIALDVISAYALRSMTARGG